VVVGERGRGGGGGWGQLQDKDLFWGWGGVVQVPNIIIVIAPRIMGSFACV